MGFDAMRAGADVDAQFASLIAITIFTGPIVAAGYNLSRRNWSKRELMHAKRTVDIEQKRRMGAEERSRIAREMHDVVAHSMNIVHMQASSAPFRVADLNEEAKAEFESIAGSARDALEEMRTHLGGVLRLDEDTTLARQPQLSDLQALVDGSANGGIEAALHLQHAPRHRPAHGLPRRPRSAQQRHPPRARRKRGSARHTPRPRPHRAGHEHSTTRRSRNASVPTERARTAAEPSGAQTRR
ncbi:sensor histidine kinase [Pseudoclavibacter sp. RFBB5]|uniref:sensor histidine kinase n=1 Tax=Pseudoclavibacter sp. RFBB5 TaxID=2080574 RepID=UPI000CE8C3DA|nr:hypothetical protein C5B97_09000 [Pseudoclavibacter sp. RFBB5]